MPSKTARPEPTPALSPEMLAMLRKGVPIAGDHPLSQQTVNALIACEVEQTIVPQLAMPPYQRTEDPAELIARHGACEDAESPRRSELTLVQVGYVDDLVNALRKFVERDAKPVKQWPNSAYKEAVAKIKQAASEVAEAVAPAMLSAKSNALIDLILDKHTRGSLDDSDVVVAIVERARVTRLIHGRDLSGFNPDRDVLLRFIAAL